MKKLFFISILLILAACNTKPQAINYGNDHCDFCEMTIVDQSFASQAVTDKGKQYKYDAIECMLQDQLQNQYTIATNLVSDYKNPGEMLNAYKAMFVINDSIKSPMGGNIAAFKDKSNKAGKLWSWNELQEKYSDHD
ncbi:nitrous oxide reductase accessory protein NosL [Zunongwangia pacifica]|uniref:Nitrous oxide reductase accessory protein NosL n=1 Tax=Zunongwangia pacifica TaxID=2911062 RepID=A0A9X2CQ30_9FLAO|nr:nitrous oxide reductase accessory protein NosL [Zunongwangia pacifica]MCL6218973.1 nitrous oxide reductase accessory protein NosL [Zunongwangia pacifica]